MFKNFMKKRIKKRLHFVCGVSDEASEVRI